MLTDLQPIWNNLEGVKYIILRNYETMQEDVANGGDIDILCESRDLIINRLALVPRYGKDNLNNCKTGITGYEIPIDVRYVGDDYYDAKWESDMLDRRRRLGNYYVIGEEDEKYSLIYHILIHKSSMAPKYNEFILRTFSTFDIECLIQELGNYMVKNNYLPVVPTDKGVCFNEANFNLLMRKVLNNV